MKLKMILNFLKNHLTRMDVAIFVLAIMVVAVGMSPQL